MNESENQETVPPYPKAERRPIERSFHGDVFVDPYEWMRDKEDSATIDYLNQQNEYAEKRNSHLGELRDELFGEIKERTQESDLSVPLRKGQYWYYNRRVEGQQYNLSCRVPIAEYGERPIFESEEIPTGEQIVIDHNIEAGDSDFYSLGGQAISDDGQLVAFATDRTGDERFDVTIRKIVGGEIVDDVLRNIGYGMSFSLDSTYLWYITVDQAWRPNKVWRHKIGTEQNEDVLIYEETDERFWMGIGRSADKRFLGISVGSKTTSEYLYLDLADPTAQLKVFEPRREGVEYSVYSAGDQFLVTHNINSADFEIATTPHDATTSNNWQPWLAPQEGERYLGALPFADFILVFTRRQCLIRVKIAHRNTTGDPNAERRPLSELPVEEVEFDDEIYSVQPARDSDFETDRVLFTYETMVHPSRVFEYNVTTAERRLLRETPVLGGVDLDNYEQKRVWATAEDGTKVPMSLAYHKDTPIDGSAPAYLTGYGSYEVSRDPYFSIPRLSMLDRGVVFALAHIRGGGEMGRAWYDNGKMLNKRNTFTDFIACADELEQGRWADGTRIAASGGSAGGLLVGAAANIAPNRFRIVAAAVPFVDALTTILKPELPLTVGEWEEWGNPIESKEVYEYMKSYTPYENVAAVDYPAILATTSLNDTRVFFTEPAKWIAELQAKATSDPATHPILLKTEMVAGHGGKSGRYNAWQEYAWETAFVLDQLGI